MEIELLAAPEIGFVVSQKFGKFLIYRTIYLR